MRNIYRFVFKDEAEAQAFAQTYLNDPHNIQVVFRGIQYRYVDTGNLDQHNMPILESVAKEGYELDIVSRNELNFKTSAFVEPDTPDGAYAQ